MPSRWDKSQKGGTGSASRDRLRVASIQMKFTPSIEDNLSSINRLLRQASKRRADVALFPECAITGYAYDFPTLKRAQLHDALGEVATMAARYQTNVLVGSPVFRGSKLCNCLVLFDRQGKVAHCYAKCHLTESDQQFFAPGNAIALFEIDDVPSTSVICHERRYPELVRLAVMAGAQILFHPNAGMDRLAVSRKKRGGNDGIAARAFENSIYYVFANSVGRQRGGRWSAGDSKIVAPDQKELELADNENEAVLVATLDLSLATGIYAKRSLKRPRFLANHWQEMVRDVRRQAAIATQRFSLPKGPT